MRAVSAEFIENRIIVLARDNYRCVYCGEPANQADHIWPQSKGGSDDIGNLVACCGDCNNIASARTFSTFGAKAAYISGIRQNVPKWIARTQSTEKLAKDPNYYRPTITGDDIKNLRIKMKMSLSQFGRALRAAAESCNDVFYTRGYIGQLEKGIRLSSPAIEQGFYRLVESEKEEMIWRANLFVAKDVKSVYNIDGAVVLGKPNQCQLPSCGIMFIGTPTQKYHTPECRKKHREIKMFDILNSEPQRILLTDVLPDFVLHEVTNNEDAHESFGSDHV